ncbi:MAG TPA: HD-GYP domain-containing protein [Actinomycetota bacterium]|nr:HD-GYP domain-containing protein [Actinomycetota bacterium]
MSDAERPFAEIVDPKDPEVSSVHAQLIVFASELGQLRSRERRRARELEEALGRLQETYLATMKALAQVVEAKDLVTRGHLDRTHAYGLALARRIEPSLGASVELGYGFFLHDIGKVGVPEGVLCKRGPLSEKEWEVMRAHPVIGAQIVEPMRFLGPAVDVVRHHHERFDGAGYPERLRGEEIPLVARMFALADSFDAMTSDRPYRRAMPAEQALEEIAEHAGTQFDPEVAKVFIRLVEDDELADEPAGVSALL